MTIKKILIAVVLFFLFISSAECESSVPQIERIDFYPVADTYVHEKSNAMPFSKMELRVGNQNTTNFGNMKSALKFDISEIPENSIINEAHLNVYSFDTKPSWEHRPIQAYSAPNDWSESSIDWFRFNDASAQIYESAFIAGLPGSSPDSYSWDITTMVQSWVNGEPNFGIILQYDFEKLNDFVIIYSSNNLIFKPYLSISYKQTESPSPVHSLPVENFKETNTLTVKESAVVDSIVKTKEVKKETNTDSLHHTASPSLITPTILNETLSNSVQTTPQAILPEITRHPQSQFKNPGASVNFLVTASGTPPLLFQWQKNGVNLADETSKILTINSISEEDAGIFTCSVSNEAGSVVSNDAELYVNDAAEIIRQPVSQSIVHGKSVTFSLEAAGTGPLAYQWKKDHINIYGATAKNYTIASAQKDDEGVFTCEVSNNFSNDISNDAILVIIAPPKITFQPQSQVKPPGTPVTFAVKALHPPLSYQWLKNGVAIDGETYETYTIDSVSEENEGTFSCSVSNKAGNMISNGAKLHIKDPAEIIKQPISQSTVHGKPVTFSLSTAGTEPLSYQWKKDHINIHGATANSYTIASVQKEDEGVYTCEVSNDFSNNISNDAILLVITSPQISQQPLSQIKNPGMPVVFSVIATGTPPLSYQWLKDGVEIDGETSGSYKIDIVSEKDEGTITCSVANEAGKISSKPAILSVNNPPEISSHPLSQTINPKSSVIFSVIASGKPPILFQWMKNGVAISNAVSDTYTINSVSEEDEGEFTCTVTNTIGSLTSKPALLSVNTPPTITHHPLSQTINPKTAITFSLKITGTPPFSYQWLKDGTAINNATSDSYTIEPVSENDEGVYTCTVSNDAGSLTSNQAVLTINDSVKIIEQPLSFSKSVGESVTFSVEATGTEPFSFQWEKNGHNIKGATSKSYTISSIKNADGGSYKCRVNNDFSNIISNRADLILKNSVQINEHPISQSKNPGAHVHFSVIATGTPPLLFQWQKDGINIDGATSKNFKIDSVSENDEGYYSCTVSNDAGSIRSDDAQLFVNDPVQIRKQPLSQSKIIGEAVTFTITATGTAPLSFQWEKDHTIIHGATSESYSIGAVQDDDGGVFTCKVSNDFSNLVSDNASLIVKISPQIIRHPQSQIKNPGAPVNFLVSASGTLPLLFQWQKDGKDINGKTSKSLTIDSISENDEGFYSCKISNDGGSITSDDAELLVNDPVQILKQPLSHSKKTGDTVTFTLTANGSSPLSFQWEKDHTIIPGATSDIYTIAAIREKDAGTYACKVYNDFSTIVSESAHLILNDSVQIIQHPKSQLKSPGMPVSFSVTTTGKPPLFYQWQKNGIDIDGANSNDFTIDSISENNEGFYSCKVSNDSEVIISDDAELLIILPPQIKQQPESQLINPGSPVTFSVTASGVPPLSFQWHKDGVDLDGATSENYTIDSVSENSEGFYSCSVTNRAGSVTSKDAELFLNALQPKSKVEKDHASDRQVKRIVSDDTPHKPAKANKSKPLASTGILETKESAVSGIKKQAKLIFKSLLLKPPAGQGLYTHNGDTLTYEGIAFPQATLVSANLEDEQGRTIRDVSKGLRINRETGDINGSIFVGSFRGAETVHLRITIQSSSNSKIVTGISNTLFLDQEYPTVQVTEPENHKIFNTSPIVIYGTASDAISGIAAVEITTDGGSTYCSVDIIRNGQWLYSFTPKKQNTEYKIRVRSKDRVGLSTESDYLTIHYNTPSASARKVIKAPPVRKSPYKINGKTEKAPEDAGIRSYRIISLSNNNFQPADLFRLKEQMAIIVKGYGGQMVTLRIIDPSIGKIMFELSDFIPPHKNKMWQWKLSQTGTFQAALIVDGSYKDDIFFTIIE